MAGISKTAVETYENTYGKAEQSNLCDFVIQICCGSRSHNTGSVRDRCSYLRQYIEDRRRTEPGSAKAVGQMDSKHSEMQKQGRSRKLIYVKCLRTFFKLCCI